jgi:iron complex transport system substrate-binding protein
MNGIREVLSRRLFLTSLGITGLGIFNPALAGQIVDAAGIATNLSAPRRIVSIGSASTEILVELGLAERIVAIDSTSKGVMAEGKVPEIGYIRALAAEGILAQSPDLIVATMDSGPKEVIEILRASKVPLIQLAIEPSVSAILSKIELLGTALDVKDQAKRVAERVAAEADALAKKIALTQTKPKALFVLGMANNRITVGGKGTAAHAVLEMSGATNIAAELSGYKPFSPEIVVSNPPDVIVLMSNANHEASIEKVLTNAALAATPAGKARAIIPVDGSELLSFGPRTVFASTALAKILHPNG